MSEAVQNINNSFFEGTYKEVWKKMMPQGLTVAEADFISEIAGLKESSKVLDIMCGYGRHSLELAARGYSVTAVDNLKDYIDDIQRAADEKQLSITAIAEDVVDLSVSSLYDAVICMGNSFAFFDRSDAVKILKKVASVLEPNGVFIINSWTIAEIAIKYFKERDWHYSGDFKCLLESGYFFNPSRIVCEQTIISPDGTVETVKGIDYIFTLDELESMFKEAGLTTKALYSTPKKRKFSLGDTQVYVVVGFEKK